MSKNGDYWQERFQQLEAAQHDTSAAKVREIQEQFDRAQAAINGKINAWYQRFADNNGVSLSEAKRLLSSQELKEFRWDVEDYIKYGEENAISGAWEKELENASARVHISRLEALKLQVQQEAEKAYGNVTDAVDRHIRSAYTSDYYHTAYEIQKGVGVGVNLQRLNTDTVEKIVSKPWAVDGKNFSDRLWESKTKLINNLHNSLTRMCITGEGPKRAIDEIAKALNVSKSQAGRVVMTESAVFANQAQHDCMKELGVEQYEVVETLDSITCETCAAMDGMHFKMSAFEVGVTAPVFHPGCRGCTCPYFDDEFDSVGERAARGEDGKTYYVPADMTYKEWKKAFVDGDKSGLQETAINVTLRNRKLSKAEGSDVHYVGKLDKNIYKCVTDDIVSDKVIITDAQIRHIQERHPGDYERFFDYLSQIVENPDYILEANKPDTAFVLKYIDQQDANFQLILRLKTSRDPVHYHNSIITFLKVDRRTWEKYLRNRINFDVENLCKQKAAE